MATYESDTQPESRNAAFADGAITRFRNRGVLQMQENVPSVLAVGGLSPDRTSTLNGQRFVTTPANGRSAETSQANPQLEQTP